MEYSFKHRLYMSLNAKCEMAAVAKKRKMPSKFLNYTEASRENLKMCGVRLICVVLEEYKGEQKMFKPYVNEMLHSIFFLGIIFWDELTPEKFLSEEMIKSLRELFSEPFDKYRSHLPKRTPFSILLDMMALKYDTQDKVMKELCCLLKKLNFPVPFNKPGNKSQHAYTLESTVICVCFNSNYPSKRYFGASLGCKTDEAKKLMICSSCINTWHKYVSYAVMSFTQEQNNDLKFPEYVKCQAYLRNWQDNTYEKLPPCKKCKTVFNLPGEDTEKEHYPYGNCAETEFLSKLLSQDPSIQENTISRNYTLDNMEKLKEQNKNSLKGIIKKKIPIRGMINNDCLPVFNPE